MVTSEVTQPVFPIVRRGYDPERVDAHVARLIGEIAELESRLARAEQVGPSPTPRSIEELGERVAQILQTAWDSGESLRAETEAEARQRLADATEEARAAEQRAAELMAEAERRLAEAEAEAGRALEEAQRASEEAVATATAEAQAAAADMVARAEIEAARIVQDATASSERALAETREAVEALRAEEQRRRESAEEELALTTARREEAAAELAQMIQALQQVVSRAGLAGDGDPPAPTDAARPDASAEQHQPDGTDS